MDGKRRNLQRMLADKRRLHERFFNRRLKQLGYDLALPPGIFDMRDTMLFFFFSSRVFTSIWGIGFLFILQTSIPSLAGLEFLKAINEGLATEIRPLHGREDEFGIGVLP